MLKTARCNYPTDQITKQDLVPDKELLDELQLTSEIIKSKPLDHGTIESPRLNCLKIESIGFLGSRSKIGR